jgi:phosphatidylserine/phosphatidylglycerophosphate/cardiolipin synthase-like enzyme
MAAVGLIATLSDGALRALAQGLRSGSLSAGSSVHRLADVLAMDAEKAASLRDALASSGTDGVGLALACECALASRRDSAAAELSKLIEVVLSGPLVEGVEMRDTAVVFSSLMREAREEVLVTSFVAGYARELLAPLADFLDADPTRRATIILNFQRGNDTTVGGELAARLADDFWTKQWPRGARRPALCYDPRGLEMEREARATMHAKVVVIDRRKAFVTSANLTARAQSENIELGVLVNHAPTAARITGYFEALIANGALVATR